MKKEAIFLIVFVIGFFLLLFHYEPSYVPNPDGSYGLAMFTSCSGDVDCDTGYICEGGSCTLGCLEDADCAADEGTCDLETGRCVAEGECMADNDCFSEAPRCDLSAQTCVECLYQEDCAGDLVCNLDTNNCEEAAGEPEPAESECIDSDGGKDYFKKGIVTASYYDDIMRRQNEFTYTDSCFTRPSPGGGMIQANKCTKDELCYVDEAYCTDDERPWSFDRDYRCKSGCEEGACLEEAKVNLCVDSDGGEEIQVYGTLSGTDIYGNVISQTDQCSGNRLFEKICTEESYTYIEHACEHGCENGACLKEAELMCEDPDGDDLSQAATTTYIDEYGNWQAMADYCIGLIGVFEGLCTEEGTFGCADQAECRRRCPKGQVCNGGACQAATTQCTDSDGENKHQAGVVTYTLVADSAEVTMKDSCAGQSFVEEGVCNAVNQGRIKILKCEQDKICQQGVCIPSPEQCTDSDGNDRTEKGTARYVNINGGQGEFTDSCVNNNQVSEGICKLNTFIFRNVPCPPGTACHNGACIKGTPATELSCRDSDGGNQYTKGTVTYTDEERKEHSKIDSCRDQHYILENYCYADTPREAARLCPNGCSEGKCEEQRRWGGQNPQGVGDED